MFPTRVVNASSKRRNFSDFTRRAGASKAGPTPSHPYRHSQALSRNLTGTLKWPSPRRPPPVKAMELRFHRRNTCHALKGMVQ